MTRPSQLPPVSRKKTPRFFSRPWLFEGTHVLSDTVANPTIKLFIISSSCSLVLTPKLLPGLSVQGTSWEQNGTLYWMAVHQHMFCVVCAHSCLTDSCREKNNLQWFWARSCSQNKHAGKLCCCASSDLSNYLVVVFINHCMGALVARLSVLLSHYREVEGWSPASVRKSLHHKTIGSSFMWVCFLRQKFRFVHSVEIWEKTISLLTERDILGESGQKCPHSDI